MPSGYPPSVFVSSTCYDLAQIRFDLKRFITGFGYEAVISESPTFPVNPGVGTVENCVNAVRERADLFVLVVGARYGTITLDGRSITNLEYLEAKAKGVPIFVFVAKAVLHTLPTWKSNPDADFSQTVDTPKLFQFVDGLRAARDHWVYEFDEVADITEILRHQWALLFTDAMAARDKLRDAHLSEALINLPSDTLRILIEKKLGWEHRLFSSVLRSELKSLSPLRHDLRYGLRIGPVLSLGDVPDVLSWMLDQVERLMRLVNSVTRLTNVALKEALGLSGKAGDAELIVYVGKRIGEVVRQMLNWTNDFANARVADEFTRMLELTSTFSNEGISKLEKIPDLLDAEIAAAEKAISEGGTYSSTIQLELNWPENTELIAELERLRKHFNLSSH
jgi:hypothetical protein